MCLVETGLAKGCEISRLAGFLAQILRLVSEVQNTNSFRTNDKVNAIRAGTNPGAWFPCRYRTVLSRASAVVNDAGGPSLAKICRAISPLRPL